MSTFDAKSTLNRMINFVDVRCYAKIKEWVVLLLVTREFLNEEKNSYKSIWAFYTQRDLSSNTRACSRVITLRECFE